MRVLFQCGGSYVSGVEVVELALMRGLSARGHHVREPSAPLLLVDCLVSRFMTVSGFIRDLIIVTADVAPDRPHVVCNGVERDFDRMYGGVNVLSAPSRSEEPFGTTLVEAGARGTPVVAIRWGGMPETVADGETGLPVTTGGPGRAGGRARRTPRRPTAGEAARSRVRFLTEHMVDRFESALTDAAR